MQIKGRFAFAGWNPGRPVAQPGAPSGQDTCIANISPRERRKRLVGGIVGIMAGWVVLILTIELGPNPWSRLGLFVPFFGGGVGVFQWRDKT